MFIWVATCPAFALYSGSFTIFATAGKRKRTEVVLSPSPPPSNWCSKCMNLLWHVPRQGDTSSEFWGVLLRTGTEQQWKQKCLL